MCDVVVVAGISAVVIGRNEGERLRACLGSISAQCDRIVYVDSGSTDDSLEIARSFGVEILELDTGVPFTAARARNAGWRKLVEGEHPFAIQFVDGDCRVEADWLACGRNQLEGDPGIAIVTGWRRELYPDLSLFNDVCDIEWNRPAGDIVTCGGDMMVLTPALVAVDGFRDDVIAAEDDEFCARIRKAGWRIRRLPVVMTHHDANMHRFGQWWRRAVRSGHGFAQVGLLHPPYFRRELIRVAVFGVMLPLAAVAGAFRSIWLPFAVFTLYGASYLRAAQGLQRQGLSLNRSLRHALLLTVSKFPNAIGAATFLWRLMAGRPMRIIEYK